MTAYHRCNKPLNFENLIKAIEDLEKNNIISFEEFKTLTIKEVFDNYFSMVHYSTIQRAIIKIENTRQGKVGPSIYETIENHITNGKLVKQVRKTRHF